MYLLINENELSVTVLGVN